MSHALRVRPALAALRARTSRPGARPASLAAAALLAALGGCRGSAPGTAPAAPATPRPEKPQVAQLGPVPASAPRPLAVFATRAVAVYPAQRLLPGDPLGWATRFPDPVAVLASFDEELRFALADRTGLGAWKWPADLERLARRARPVRIQLRDLPVDPLQGKVGEAQRTVPAGVAESMRLVLGFTDARWGFLPVHLRFVPVPPNVSGAGDPAAPVPQRAVLRVALVDARTGEVGFLGEVVGDPFPAWSPAVLASLAGRVADQFLAP